MACVYRNAGLGAVSAVAFLLVAAMPAVAANCDSSDIAAYSVTAASVGSYSTYGAAPPPAPFTVSITTRANCTNLLLGLTGLAGTFAPAAPGLAFTVTGGAPTVTSPLDININRTTATRTWTVSMAAGQIAPAGSYATSAGTTPLVNLYVKRSGRLQQPPIRSAPLDVSVNVLPACQLSAPVSGSVDLSAAILNGTANPGVVSTVVFPSATCTAPARIRLSGAALQPIASIAPRAGFDAFINWRAQAIFGTTTAVLATSGTAQGVALSPTRNQGSGAGTPGSVSVSVNLLSGNQIIAGSYAGTLTVAIDPSF